MKGFHSTGKGARWTAFQQMAVFCLFVFNLSLLTPFVLLPNQSLDVYFLIAQGDQMIREKSIPLKDVYSYGEKRQPILQGQWLTSVVYAKLHEKGGLAALFALKATMAFLSLLFLFMALPQSPPMSRVAALSVPATIFYNYFNLRGVSFTLLFSSFVLFFLLRYPKKLMTPAGILLLGGLTAIWGNFHGAQILAPIFVLLTLISQGIERKIDLLETLKVAGVAMAVLLAMYYGTSGGLILLPFALGQLLGPKLGLQLVLIFLLILLISSLARFLPSTLGISFLCLLLWIFHRKLLRLKNLRLLVIAMAALFAVFFVKSLLLALFATILSILVLSERKIVRFVARSVTPMELALLVVVSAGVFGVFFTQSHLPGLIAAIYAIIFFSGKSAFSLIATLILGLYFLLEIVRAYPELVDPLWFSSACGTFLYIFTRKPLHLLYLASVVYGAALVVPDLHLLLPGLLAPSGLVAGLLFWFLRSRTRIHTRRTKRKALHARLSLEVRKKVKRSQKTLNDLFLRLRHISFQLSQFFAYFFVKKKLWQRKLLFSSFVVFSLVLAIATPFPGLWLAASALFFFLSRKEETNRDWLMAAASMLIFLLMIGRSSNPNGYRLPENAAKTEKALLPKPMQVHLDHASLFSLPIWRANSIQLPVPLAPALEGFHSTLGYLTEWQPPSLTSPFYAPYLGILLVAFCLLLFFRRELSPATAFFSLLALPIPFLARRHIALSGVLLYPLFAESLSLIFRQKNPQALWLSMATLLYFLFFPYRWIFSLEAWNLQRFLQKSTPVDAITFLKENNVKKRVFNDLGWGGMMMYALYPRYKISADGRFLEVYTREYLTSCYKILDGQQSHVRFFDQYKINTVFIRPGTGLYVALSEDPEWLLIYEDGQSSIFGRRDWVEERKNWRLPESDLFFVWQGIRKERLGKVDEALASYRRALEIYPPSKDARARLIALLLRTGQYRQALQEWDKLLIDFPLFPQWGLKPFVAVAPTSIQIKWQEKANLFNRARKLMLKLRSI